MKQLKTISTLLLFTFLLSCQSGGQKTLTDFVKIIDDNPEMSETEWEILAKSRKYMAYQFPDLEREANSNDYLANAVEMLSEVIKKTPTDSENYAENILTDVSKLTTKSTLKAFQLKNLETGKKEKLFSYFNQKDKDIVLVSFWSQNCGPCLKKTKAFHEAAKNNSDIQFLMIALDEEQSHSKIKEVIYEKIGNSNEKLHFQILTDNKINSDKYGYDNFETFMALNTRDFPGVPLYLFFANDGTFIKEGAYGPKDKNPFEYSLEKLKKKDS